MDRNATVVTGQTRRRWLCVLGVFVVLLALPLVVRAWPVQAAAVAPAALRERIAASAGRPYQGYAQATGTLGLPELPRLADLTSLLSTTTDLRTWYAAPDRWRVDQLGPGSEQGLYRRPDGEYRWDYADEQVTKVIGEQPPVRLPRAADLVPPELGRRLVAATKADPVSALPQRRIAGMGVAGLRVVPADRSTTIAHIDIWATADGLPVQIEVSAKGGLRPVLTSRFLEFSAQAPAEDVITPPAPHPGIGYTTTDTPDLVSTINRLSPGTLPDSLVGRPRRAAVDDVSAAGVYGSGLTELVVLAAPGRLGRQAYRTIAQYGTPVQVPRGEAAVVSTSLLSVLVVNNDESRQTYLVAGLIDPAVLKSAGVELAEGTG